MPPFYFSSVLVLSLDSFHTRENRGFDIVKHTTRSVLPSSPVLLLTCSLSSLFWYAVLESLGIVGMAVYVPSPSSLAPAHPARSLQVYILQTFFTKTGRRYKV